MQLQIIRIYVIVLKLKLEWLVLASYHNLSYQIFFNRWKNLDRSIIMAMMVLQKKW